MRRRLAFLLFLGLLTVSSAPAWAQGVPQVCSDALEVRSPQGQVEMFTQCLDTGRLSGNYKATTFKQRAIAYMHLGQHQRAIEDVNQAIKINPSDADNFYLRGLAYRALGQHQRALEDSNQAIGLDSKFAAAYGNRAFVNKALGNISQAKSDARRAVEIDPKVKVPTF